MVGLKDFEMPSCCNSCSHWSFNRDYEPLFDLTYEHINQFDKRQVDYPLVEAIPKADYENRLKVDMATMLTKLQLEIEELDSRAGYDGNGMPTFSTDYIRKKKVNELIQQKIDALKEQTDGKA